MLRTSCYEKRKKVNGLETPEVSEILDDGMLWLSLAATAADGKEVT